MAKTAALVGEELGMARSGTSRTGSRPGHRAARLTGLVVQIRTPEKDGYSALQ